MTKRRKKKAEPAPAPTFWLELDEDDVANLLTMPIPSNIYAACKSFQAWCVSPAAGIAQQQKEIHEEKKMPLTRRDTRDSSIVQPPQPRHGR